MREVLCACACACVGIHVYMCMLPQKPTRVRIWMFVCVCMHASMYVCIYAYTHTYIIHTYIHITHVQLRLPEKPTRVRKNDLSMLQRQSAGMPPHQRVGHERNYFHLAATIQMCVYMHACLLLECECSARQHTCRHISAWAMSETTSIWLQQ